ncbi:apolipoprotein N-acyltransferase [bacterium]
MTRFDFGLIALTGFALILSFPPFLGGPVAMVALIPLLHFVGGKSARIAFVGGYLIGFIWTVGTLYWIGWATIAGFLGAAIYIPIFIGFLTCLLNWLIHLRGHSVLWFTPFLWTGMEIIQSSGVMGFPWNQLANSQTIMIPFIQFASIFGSYGIGFWVVLINVILFWLIKGFGKNQRTIVLISSLILVLSAPYIYGQHVLKKRDLQGATINIALVQGNIDPYKKWTPSFVDSNFVVYQRLTKMAEIHSPDLIVWPETATPCYLRYRFHYLSEVKSIAKYMNCPIITGSPDYEWNKQGKAITYNASLLIHPESPLIQRYYKKHLVPFSERVPLVDKLPFFYRWLSSINLDVGNYAPGDSTYVFTVNRKKEKPFRFGSAICFDSAFPLHVQELVKKGAQFLIIMTNDAWFGHTSGPYQHAQLAVIRAIETRRWVVRCANTGISGFIDPWGRYQQKSDFQKEALLHQKIFLKNNKTFFVRYGHIFIYLMLLCNVLIILYAFIKRQNIPEMS